MRANWMRLSAIAIAATFAVGLRNEIVWQSAVVSTGFGHYLLSLWYGRGRLAALGQQRSSAIAATAAVAVGSVLYAIKFPLILYFAVHHACNETYINGGLSEPLPEKARRRLRFWSLALHTVLYFTLLRSEFAEIFVRRGLIESTADMQRPSAYFLLPLAVVYLEYFAALWTVRSRLGTRGAAELAIPELAGLALVAVSCMWPIRFLDVVCYHFVFWWFYPAAKLAVGGRRAVSRYAAAMAGLTAATFLVSPAVLPDYPFRDSMYLRQFLLWSHIHITSSYFLSSANPEWIRKWFTRVRMGEPAAQAASG